jgi:hypothetical protein
MFQIPTDPITNYTQFHAPFLLSMQFSANDVFDHAGADPVVTVGIFAAPCVKYLHRSSSCVHGNTQIFG